QVRLEDVLQLVHVQVDEAGVLVVGVPDWLNNGLANLVPRKAEQLGVPCGCRGPHGLHGVLRYFEKVPVPPANGAERAGDIFDALHGLLPLEANNLVQLPVKRRATSRSEEHTSELQSRENLVCRL